MPLLVPNIIVISLPMNDAGETISVDEAYQRCLALLARREHSQWELTKKMQQHGVNSEIIDAVLSRLIANHYQSDERFAEVFCRSRVSRKVGAKKIRYELKQKGIDAQLAETEINQYHEQFLDNAKALIERKAPRADVALIFTDFKLKDKITRSLLNKGYDYDTIRLALENLQEETV